MNKRKNLLLRPVPVFAFWASVGFLLYFSITFLPYDGPGWLYLAIDQDIATNIHFFGLPAAIVLGAIHLLITLLDKAYIRHGLVGGITSGLVGVLLLHIIIQRSDDPMLAMAYAGAIWTFLYLGLFGFVITLIASLLLPRFSANQAR